MAMTREERRKGIRDSKRRITDKDLFTSNKYQDSLTKTAKAVTGKRVRVHIGYDEEGILPIGITDGKEVFINAGNPITGSFQIRELKAECILGILAHECGHVKYSDFWLLIKYLEGFENKRIYPYAPEPEGDAEESALAEMKGFVQTGDKVAVRVIADVANRINNILEDIYIEMRMCEEYPGSIRRGITLMANRMTEEFPTVRAEVERGDYNLSIILNLILQYARLGGVNNWDGYEGEFMDLLEDCADAIDEAVVLEDASGRFHATNRILLKIWKHVKEFIDEAKEGREGEKSDEMMGKLSEQVVYTSENGKADASESSRSVPEDWEADGETEEGGDLPESKSEDAEEAEDSTEGEEDDGGAEPKEEGKTDKDEVGMNSHELERLEGFRKSMVNPEGECEEADGAGDTIMDFDYEGAGQEDAASDMNRILNEMAEERMVKKEEAAITKGLKDEAGSMDFGDVHKGCDKVVHRMAKVPQKYVDDFGMVVPSITRYVNKLVEGFKDILKNKEPQVTRGTLSGRRINQSMLHRRDGRIFDKKLLPDEEMDLAICLLVDESGSMGFDRRIDYARLASLTLYIFCRKLGIPIMVYGHSVSYGKGSSGTVDLYSYAEPDSSDGNDGYRIMDMRARSDNRDGAALRFAGERLYRREEKVKILILISDGQPAASGYSGTLAENDLRGIKKDLTNRGIILFAAAIGDDKEEIERIYGDGFLDVSNLETLPKKLTKLVSNYVR